MTARPTEPIVRAHEMSIYKRYFDLIASGRKTTEIRVNDSSRKDQGRLADPIPLPGRRRAHTRYPRRALRRLRRDVQQRVRHSVNPLATCEEQLADIRQIYPPEREALGVVAIGIELVDPPLPSAQ